MLKTVLLSFVLALNNIRAHFFHTVLSVLGIVIGVAALVAILSLIDGLEEFAKDQIAKTTSLKAVMVQPEPHKKVNGVAIKKDSLRVLMYEDYQLLRKHITRPCNVYLYNLQAGEITIQGQPSAAYISGVSAIIDSHEKILAGRSITADDTEHQKPIAVLNKSLAQTLVPDSAIATLLNQSVQLQGISVIIVGVVDVPMERPTLFLPITLMAHNQLKQHPPTAILEADAVEDVPIIKEEAQQWLTSYFGVHAADFTVGSNEYRVKQAVQGFVLFRVIMGLIVGISVLVGGIGVMNVLLISVTERTVEIGIRKAVGANKKHIVLQFLSESLTISAFGSFLGLVVGILCTMAFVPIIKALTDIPFYAAYTQNTFLVITLVSLVVGIVFGTYPAIRAARLDPVEAIRRE